MKWIEIKRDDKKTWPRIGENILFADGNSVWAGWLECYEPEEDPSFYADLGDDESTTWPENVTHWAIWPSPQN